MSPWLLIPAGAVLLATALLVPSQGLVMDRAAPAVSILVAVSGLVFSGVLFAIVFRAGEWPPATLALGCLAMALANLAPAAAPGVGLNLLQAEGVTWLPNLGMFVGGIFFGLGAIPRWPTGTSSSRNVRVLLVAVAVLLAVITGITAVSQAVPDESLTRLLAALASAGYVVATVQFSAAYRFARLPSQLTTAIGSAAFVPLTVLLAAGGITGVPASAFQAVMLAAAAFPVAGFVLEQRARPGLRTMVLSLWLPRAIDQMERGHPSTMRELLERIGTYDAELRGHVDRVAELAVQVAVELSATPVQLRNVMLAAQVHDIGKLFVPKSIVDKPGRLDDHEFAQVKRHAEKGADLIRRIPGFASAVDGVRQHHERWDGSGYPEGLAGPDITFEARVLAVADVYDALVSRRAYKDAMAANKALAVIRSESGRHFDPAMVSALDEVLGGRDTEPLAA